MSNYQTALLRYLKRVIFVILVKVYYVTWFKNVIASEAKQSL